MQGSRSARHRSKSKVHSRPTPESGHNQGAYDGNESEKSWSEESREKDEREEGAGKGHEGLGLEHQEGARQKARGEGFKGVESWT
jgi:hypothetical protein